MLFEPYFEHSSKWTNLVSHFLTCSQRNKKYWLCWQSSTAFGFAVLLRVWIDVCQRYWPHGVLHQKMRRLRNLQFLCSLWQRGFFLHVNFSRFKTPPALHSVAKCFAASTQHWRLWKTKLQKLLDPKTLYESIFSSVFFWEQTLRVGLCLPAADTVCEAFHSLCVAHCIPKNTAFRSSAKSCHWQFLAVAAKVQLWKFPSFGNTHFRARLHSAFWTNNLWRRAFYVRRSLKGLRKHFERILEPKCNVVWTLFWTFFEMDKSCVPLPNLQSVKQKGTDFVDKVPLSCGVGRAG